MLKGNTSFSLKQKNPLQGLSPEEERGLRGISRYHYCCNLITKYIVAYHGLQKDTNLNVFVNIFVNLKYLFRKNTYANYNNNMYEVLSCQSVENCAAVLRINLSTKKHCV